MGRQAIETDLTVKQLNALGKPDDVVFRQTLNRESRKWWCPKRRMPDGVWRTINQKEQVRIGPKENPYKFSLWKIWDVMAAIKYADGLPVWDCEKIKKFRRPGYTVMYLHCKRLKHSIHGIM